MQRVFPTLISVLLNPQDPLEEHKWCLLPEDWAPGQYSEINLFQQTLATNADNLKADFCPEKTLAFSRSDEDIDSLNELLGFGPSPLDESVTETDFSGLTSETSSGGSNGGDSPRGFFFCDSRKYKRAAHLKNTFRRDCPQYFFLQNMPKENWGPQFHWTFLLPKTCKAS